MPLCSSRKKIIPVIQLYGFISSKSSVSFKNVNKLIDKAFGIPNISVLVIIINSPGGSPVQSELISKRIRTMAAEHNIEVITFIEDCAASGGYYLACAGDEIWGSSSSIVGSIGVVSSSFGLSDFIARHGITRRIYTQGTNKAILDPFLPLKQSDIDILNSVSKDIHQEFIDYVKERRGNKLNNTDTSLFTGAFWSGKKAVELGLIDGISNMYSILESKYGKHIEIKYITEHKSMFESIKSFINPETAIQNIIGYLINTVKSEIIYNTLALY